MNRETRTTHANGWEHRQVDLQIDPTVDGIAPIYTFSRLPLRLIGVVESGTLVDLMLLENGDRFLIELVERPAIHLNDDTADRSTLCRSWRVSGPDISIHAEIWVDDVGRGFADLFAQRVDI